jgi:hypothetical protein
VKTSDGNLFEEVASLGISEKLQVFYYVKTSDGGLFEEVANLGISEKLQALS